MSTTTNNLVFCNWLIRQCTSIKLVSNPPSFDHINYDNFDRFKALATMYHAHTPDSRVLEVSITGITERAKDLLDSVNFANEVM